MSMADEMLNTLSGDEIEAYAVAEEHIVIGRDRFITVPEALKRIAVQFDHNIETVTFDCPRYWDENDLTDMTIYVNYLCPGEITPGSFVAENVTVDETDSEMIHFTWTITGEVTQKKGTLKFLVCAKSVDDNGLEVLRWNSEINTSMYISEGMDATEQIFERNPDFLTQVLLLADELRNNGAIATIDKTLSMEGSVADAAAVGQALAGKASKTTIPNSATVNEDNELVMQHTEGDAVEELFKVALPAGGSEVEEVVSFTTEEEVVSLTIPLTQAIHERIASAETVYVFCNIKKSLEETYTEHGKLTATLKQTKSNGSVMVNYKLIDNKEIVPRTDQSYIGYIDSRFMIEKENKLWASRRTIKIAAQNQAATVTSGDWENAGIGYDANSSNNSNLIIESANKMGAGSTFRVLVK